MTIVHLKRLPHGEGLPLPAYHSAHAAGLDLLAAIEPHTKVVIEPGARELVPTGVTLQLPIGFEGQVRPRSGLAHRFGVTVLNAPGTIDADYRGGVGVVLINHGEAPFTVTRGMRIAQLVVGAVTHVGWNEVESLPESARGAAGFGSTGTGASRAKPESRG